MEKSQTENPRKINKKNKKIIRSNYIIRNISEIIPGKIYCKKKKTKLNLDQEKIIIKRNKFNFLSLKSGSEQPEIGASNQEIDKDKNKS